MREHVSQSKKANTASFSIPSLKHRIPGFGLDSPQASPQAVPLVQPLHKPLTHDISRIPLRNPQAKLSISQPGDKYEQEADSVAQQVMQRMAQPVNRQSIQPEAIPEESELQMKPLANSITPVVQREALPKSESELQMKSLDNSILQRQQAPEDESELQMKSMVQRQAEASMVAAPDLEASINQARGGGQVIAKNIRHPMEVAFGADFNGVKVHTDGQSDQLNRSIQARAFTTGQDVFFRQGEYNPGSRGGQELLAHELTHVVQQSGGARNQRRGKGEPIIQRVIKAEASAVNDLSPEEINDIISDYPSQEKEIKSARDSSEVYVIKKLRKYTTINKVTAKEPNRNSGAMYGRVGGPQRENEGLHTLAFVAITKEATDEVEQDYSTEKYGTFGMNVGKVTGKRKAKHQGMYKLETGYNSAKDAVAAIFGSDKFRELDFDITHLKGWGQVGPNADTTPKNLVAATKHANTEMMFFDNVITGRTDIRIRTWAEVFRDTTVAKKIMMEFAYVDAPDHPFFKREVYALRPEIRSEEARKLREEAKLNIVNVLEAVEGLLLMHKRARVDEAKVDEEQSPIL